MTETRYRLKKHCRVFYGLDGTFDSILFFQPDFKDAKDAKGAKGAKGAKIGKGGKGAESPKRSESNHGFDLIFFSNLILMMQNVQKEQKSRIRF